MTCSLDSLSMSYHTTTGSYGTLFKTVVVIDKYCHQTSCYDVVVTKPYLSFVLRNFSNHNLVSAFAATCHTMHRMPYNRKSTCSISRNKYDCYKTQPRLLTFEFQHQETNVVVIKYNNALLTNESEHKEANMIVITHFALLTFPFEHKEKQNALKIPN